MAGSAAIRPHLSDKAICLAADLCQWLVGVACPLWSAACVDWADGGFHEALDGSGHPVKAVKRARVAPRQIYAFARARDLGWAGDPSPIIRHGLRFIEQRFLRADGFYRSTVQPDGAPADDRAYLYDQAFILLGFAEAERRFGVAAGLRPAAHALRTHVLAGMRHSAGGFRSGTDASSVLLSNPIMHLLEAALAWREIDADPLWQSMADDIGQLAMTRLVHPNQPCLREYFADDWSMAPGLAGQIVEPGHQFEWAWLLLRWRPDSPEVRSFARGLIDFTLRSGVQDGFAVNAILDTLIFHDSDARLWPQAEWIKAMSVATTLFGVEAYEAELIRAAEAMAGYLATPLPGLWHDTRLASGAFGNGPAPASNFYHIVSAIGEFAQTCGLQGEGDLL